MAVTSLLGTAVSVYAAASLAEQASGTPKSWAAGATALWTAFLASKHGWAGLQRSDRWQLAWGLASTCVFLAFLLTDPSFQAWGDVFYYCGARMQYCTCDLRWNLRGWAKAAVLWSFILSTALAAQKLVIQAGLRGLLPGEEVVTKESFISICWRLIPYWLNNWEQQWGAETSSMMFELPHFSIELLVVLPCVQILCSRLRILMLPAGHPLWPEMLAARGGRAGGRRRGNRALAPDAIQGIWHHMPEQHRLLPRLRANLRMLLMVLAVTALAGFNALHTPLALEAQIHGHPRSRPLAAAAAICGASPACWAAAELGPANAAALRAHAAACPSPEPLVRALRKHGREIAKMAGPAHAELIPLVEAALAVMRLSCERYFALLSMFAAYLACHGAVPRWGRRLIRLNHQISRLFQQVILNAFPAVCWLYGAGTLFSAFVSAVFWGGAARRLAGRLRALASVVEPQGMQDASDEQVERMNGSCAICWGVMEAGRAAAASTAGQALPCGHAFHGPCIQRWLKQCHGQARQPTCPLCNRAILLQVSYRLPLRFRRARPPPPPQPEAQQPAAAEAAPRPPRQERQAGAPAQAAGTSASAVPPLPTQALAGQQAARRGAAPGGRAASGAEAGSSGQAAGASGQQTQRSAPPWPQGPSLPVSLAPGTAPANERGRARWRCRPAGPRAAVRGSGSGSEAPAARPLGTFQPAAQPPTAFAFTSARPPQAGSSAGLTGGASSSGQSGGVAGPELSAAAVRRDLQRSRAYLDFMAAQEAQMQATIERCSGVMAEAWQTARELLRNAEQLEQMLQQPASADGPGGFAELWQRQQRLWQRSQELHREGAAFTGP